MVHGLITQIPPVKQSKRDRAHHRGFVSDGKKSLKFVGFSMNDQEKLLIISPGKILEGRDGNDVQLMIGNSSSIFKRPRKFNVCDEEWTRIDPDSLVEITLDKLQEQVKYQRVRVSAKVVGVDDVTHSASNKALQDITLADSTGNARLTLWEDDVQKLKVVAYCFTNVTVNIFNEIAYLTFGREATFEVLDEAELGVLVETVEATNGKKNSVEDASIMSVSNFKKSLKCISCEGNMATVPAPGSSSIRCEKCCSIQ